MVKVEIKHSLDKNCSTETIFKFPDAESAIKFAQEAAENISEEQVHAVEIHIIL